MRIIDLRSDTVTLPTNEMRTAMAAAKVGDDVYGEDPTINELQELSADMLGKEAGLFIPSGTMGNLIATLVHCQRGDEVIMGDLGHTFLFEAGGIAALGGVFPHTLRNQPDGTLNMADLQGAIRPDDIHHPHSKLVILENTHNRCGGVVLSREYTQDVGEFAHEKGLALHIDGARIFNAVAATGVTAKELAEPADSITFCLSKALCAPVGSVLCGSKDFIGKARRLRKMLGGGMRQAGILAAAGIISLQKMTDRLSEDHKRAASLAEGLSLIPGISFEMGKPQTNMVFPYLTSVVSLTPSEVATKLAEKGIKIGVVGPRSFRLVTHYWISDEDVTTTIQAFREILTVVRR
jgi:threonine aldolase